MTPHRDQTIAELLSPIGKHLHQMHLKKASQFTASRAPLRAESHCAQCRPVSASSEAMDGAVSYSNATQLRTCVVIDDVDLSMIQLLQSSSVRGSAARLPDHVTA